VALNFWAAIPKDKVIGEIGTKQLKATGGFDWSNPGNWWVRKKVP
jgi:hypothetical protein